MSHVEFLLLGYLFASSADPTKADEAKLEGTWELVSIEAKETISVGEEAKKEQISCVISGKSLTLRQGHQTFQHTFTVRSREKPPALDTTFPEGKGVNHAIYRLEGDKLTICVSRKWNPNEPEERPIQFTTKRSENKELSGLVVYAFERKPRK